MKRIFKHFTAQQIICDKRLYASALSRFEWIVCYYSISKTYEETIRKRTSLFQHVEKTKKDLRITFITTYGVKKNEHSGIVDNEVILADLFI